MRERQSPGMYSLFLKASFKRQEPKALGKEPSALTAFALGTGRQKSDFSTNCHQPSVKWPGVREVRGPSHLSLNLGKAKPNWKTA